MKLFAMALLAVALSAPLCGAQSISIFPAQIFTGTGQTGATIRLNQPPFPSSWSVGSITLTGTSLTTVTFSVMGSSDNGSTYYALPIYTATSPGATPTTTMTATANGLYQVNLAGITNVKLVTSGTFTAASVSLTFVASPNGNISTNGSLTLIQSQVLTGTASSVTFSAIPQGYRDLKLIIQCSSSGSFPYGKVQFNGDAASHYAWSWIYWSNTAQAAGASSDTSAEVFNAGFNSGTFAATQLDIFNYASATLTKYMTALAYDSVQNTSDSIGGAWNETAAITSIVLQPNSGNFPSGSTFTLYGIN
jgi:hypothetical protein